MSRQKYEREIDEILERLERQGQQLPQQPLRRRDQPRWPRLPPVSTVSVRWTSGTWLALSLGLPLLATLLTSLVPPFASWLVIAGILIFLSPLVLRFVAWSRQDRRPTWRGRPMIEMPNRGNSRAAWLRYQIWVWGRRWERWRGGR